MIDLMDEYRRWANLQVCTDCGKKFSERKKDANGHLEPWVTETLCMPCAAERLKRVEEKRYWSDPAHWSDCS